MCGRVIIDKIPDGLGQVSRQRKVTLTGKSSGKVHSLTTDSSGNFCAEVTPGAYVAEVSTYT